MVHETGKGAKETGLEIGKDSVKVTEGTVVKVDHEHKTVVVKSADGTEKTFEYTETAGKDMGQTVTLAPFSAPTPNTCEPLIVMEPSFLG